MWKVPGSIPGISIFLFSRFRLLIWNKKFSCLPVSFLFSEIQRVNSLRLNEGPSRFSLTEPDDYWKTLSPPYPYPCFHLLIPDPATKRFLEANFDPVFGFPSFVRFSWSTAANIIDTKGVQVNWWVATHDISSPGTQMTIAGKMSQFSKVCLVQKMNYDQYKLFERVLFASTLFAEIKKYKKWRSGVRTQNLSLAKRMLYHWATTPC